MPTYPWKCKKCRIEFETVESIVEYNGRTKCPKCKKVTKDRIMCANIVVIGSSVQHAEYNPAFGQVVKNKKERDELAKRRGMIEIGNEKTDTIHKIAADTKEHNRKRSWEEV